MPLQQVGHRLQRRLRSRIDGGSVEVEIKAWHLCPAFPRQTRFDHRRLALKIREIDFHDLACDLGLERERLADAANGEAQREWKHWMIEQVELPRPDVSTVGKLTGDAHRG